MKQTKITLRAKQEKVFLKVKSIWEGFSNWFHNKVEDAFSSRKKTFQMLAVIVFTVLFGIEMAIILIRNSFYSNFSDDILQYYTIIVDFISQIKTGSLSFFNLNNYLGASYFSDVYYIPLDIFTFITFLLSYLMPTQLAYSVTELFKIFAGVMVFSYYLSKQGYKNRTIFWMGIVYFVSGGTVSFMAFPVFLSLTFYLPLGLLVIQWAKEGHKWIVPLYAMALVFYDFYLAYTALIFTGLMFILEYVKRPGFKFWHFLWDGAVFLFLLVLGVGMSLVILYPSVLFIIEDTYRPTGRFTAWVIDIFGYQLKLFKPEIYIRFLAKMFAEQRPVGFYGFLQDYTKEHVSLYITMTGLALMSYVWFMKDKISRIYKVTIVIGLVLMFFPLFSYVFSGTTDQPYTRWINLYPLVMTMILAHVFDKYGFENVKMKFLTIPLAIYILLDSFLIYYYIHRLNELGTSSFANGAILWVVMTLVGIALVLIITTMKPKNVKTFKRLLSLPATLFVLLGAYLTYLYVHQLNDLNALSNAATVAADLILFIATGIVVLMILAFGWLGILHQLQWSLALPIVLVLGTGVGLISGYVVKINSLGGFQYADALTGDWILMAISGMALVLILVLGWLKKPEWFKKILLVEAAIALVYAYSGSFYIKNKNTTFAEMYAINDFLKDNLKADTEFFRVYVDMDRFNVEKTNFNRMTIYPTNTEIFHSWTDSETDGLSYLLFANSDDIDQTKKLLNAQAIYINQFLGYKYILASADYNYYIDESLFRIIAANDKYQLIEIINARPFEVYEKYTTETDFANYRQRNNDLQTQKILLMAAIIDDERYQDFAFNLEEEFYTGASGVGTISASKHLSQFETVTTGGVLDTAERVFYKFDFGSSRIGFTSGDVYIKGSTTIPASSEVFMEFSDGALQSCTVGYNANEDVKCGQFWSQPEAIYIEAEGLSDRFAVDYRLQMARDRDAYLVYDLSGITYTGNKGVLYFELSKPFGRVFFVDAEGNEYEGFKNYYYFNTPPVRMYVWKTYEMYTEVSNLFNFSLRYTYDDLSAYDESTSTSLYEDGSLTIKHARISLQYHRTSDSTYDQLVVIPVAYSEEWTFVSEQKYETMSASGGFLGIIVPSDVTDIDIELKFVPKGIVYGGLGTLGSTLIYLGIFVPGWIIKGKRRKKAQAVEAEEMNQA